jgi:membrane protein implicated in regulation of membrane protease activity
VMETWHRCDADAAFAAARYLTWAALFASGVAIGSAASDAPVLEWWAEAVMWVAMPLAVLALLRAMRCDVLADRARREYRP